MVRENRLSSKTGYFIQLIILIQVLSSTIVFADPPQTAIAYPAQDDLNEEKETCSKAVNNPVVRYVRKALDYTCIGSTSINLIALCVGISSDYLKELETLSEAQIESLEKCKARIPMSMATSSLGVLLYYLNNKGLPLLVKYLDECDLESCPICLNKMKVSKDKTATIQLNCSHRFHPKCIKSWLKTESANHALCPLCRTFITHIGECSEQQSTQEFLNESEN